MCVPIVVIDGGSEDPVAAIAMSNCGCYLVVARQDGQVEEWTCEGELLNSHKEHRQQIRSIAVSNDPFAVVSLSVADQSGESELCVWQPGRSVNMISDGAGPLESAAIVPGSNLVAATNSGKVVYIDVQTGDRSYPAIEGVEAETLAASQDGRLLAVATRQGPIVIWDRSKEEIAMELQGHRGSVCKLTFSDDGSQLASLGCDETFRIWGLGIKCEMRCIETPRAGLLDFAPMLGRDSWFVVDPRLGVREFGLCPEEDFVGRLPDSLFARAAAQCHLSDVLAIADHDGVISLWARSFLMCDVPVLGS